MEGAILEGQRSTRHSGREEDYNINKTTTWFSYRLRLLSRAIASTTFQTYATTNGRL